MSDRNSSKSLSKSSSKSSQLKPAKKPNTSTANPNAKKMKPVAIRAQTDTSVTSVAESVTEFVVVDDMVTMMTWTAAMRISSQRRILSQSWVRRFPPFFFITHLIFSCSSEDLAIHYLPFFHSRCDYWLQRRAPIPLLQVHCSCMQVH
jgi:hypothetical protein